MQVPLGVINANEAYTSEMITILEELHKYVPQVTQEVSITTTESYSRTKSVTMVYPILLGGDQLSTSRARSAKATKRTEKPYAERLDGLVPVFEDWHTRVTLISVRQHDIVPLCMCCHYIFNTNLHMFVYTGHLDQIIQGYMGNPWYSLSATESLGQVIC
jgi:hypothetical protein